MSFRVTATVEKVSPSGLKYPFILYCGEFDGEELSPEEALAHTESRTAELHPSIKQVRFEFEDIPDPRTIH